MRTALATPPTLDYRYGNSMDARTRAVARALKHAPCSLRALAREASISHVWLVQIREGRRPATAATAAKIARALRVWSATCDRLAAAIDRSTPQRGS